MQVSALVDDIIGRARVRGISNVRLAEKAGIRPETLTRLKNQENADFRTIANLAMAVGLRITLSPVDQQSEVGIYSPLDNASQKRAERQANERLLSQGLISREDLNRQTGSFGFPAAEFEVKSLRSRR